MHKRVLVAESAEAIRSVAETVLRQNGFEVISLPTVEKAQEVLQFSIPDVLIIGADLVAADGRPFYETIQADPRTASIPLLLFDSTESEGLPFPDEVIISRPFDPRDFIQRVQVFSGQASGRKASTAGSTQAADTDLDEELLDHALGLDQIHVTSSEVMDATTRVGKKAAAGESHESLVGMAHHGTEESSSDTGKVESLMIRDDTIAPPGTTQQRAAAPQKHGTGPIEILHDQYGISKSPALESEPIDENHDYDWFINAMRDEGVSPEHAPRTDPGAQHEHLPIDNPSAAVDPHTPVSAAGTTQARAPHKPKTAGVEKFIDEFREEMERIRTTEEPPQVVTVRDEHPPGQSAAAGEPGWQEQVERLGPADLAMFSRQFASELAAKIAEKIVSKIDGDKLMKLIAAEIAARTKKG